MTDAQEISKKFKFSVASDGSNMNPWATSIFPYSGYEIDRPGVPTDWYKTVQLCNFFYERDGLVRSTIDKQVEIGIGDINIAFDTPVDPEIQSLYSNIATSIVRFLSQAATEYFISGLVVIEPVWDILPKMSSKFSKDYLVPVDLWLRNPLQIVLKSTPLPNKLAVYWKSSSDEVSFIQNKGKYSDGTEDVETYKLLKEQFPEYVRSIEKNVDTFKLENVYVIRRKPVSRTQYPVPYLSPAIELLIHKRNLRKMDYAIASRVLNAILHIKVGNDTFPVTQDDDDIIDSLEYELRRRGNSSNFERIIELFTNHTVEINWVVPPMEALLNSEKYDNINHEIFYALGFPKFLITGEKERSNTGSTSSAMLSPLNTLKQLRVDFEDFVAKVFQDVATKNNLKEIPRATFAPLNLVALEDLIKFSQELETKGIISRTSLTKLAGFDFVQEQRIRKTEISENEGDLVDENNSD